MAAVAIKPVLVLDTNLVLDLLVFKDPAVEGLRQSLEDASVEWLVTEPMRAELERVLGYPRIAKWLQTPKLGVAAVLAPFDRLSQPRAVAALATIRCSDPDDQMFIDLAVAHHAQLLSKDLAVLRLRKRLAAVGVEVMPAV